MQYYVFFRREQVNYTYTISFPLSTESFWSLAPDCFMVLCCELLVDWIKHAFITRFNEVSAEVYKDYTIHLAYDLAQTKQANVSERAQDIAVVVLL